MQKHSQELWRALRNFPKYATGKVILRDRGAPRGLHKIRERDLALATLLKGESVGANTAR